MRQVLKFQRSPWLATPILGAIALASATAMARDERSVVVWSGGADADELASRVASHLHAPYVAGDAAAFRRSLASARAPSLAAAARDPGSDAKLVAGARLAARAAHLDAAVLLYARRSKRGTVVHVWLVDPKGEGSADADVEVALAAGMSVDAEADAAWNAVAQQLPGQGAPAPPPPAFVESSETVPAGPATSAMPVDADHGAREIESTAEHAEPTRSAALASIGAAIQVGARDFSYVDRITPTLRPYDLVAAPLVSVDAELYPLARSRTPVLKDLGATFDYSRAFGLASADSAGTSVSTTWNELDFGARARFPIGHAVLAGIHGGYGEIDYSFHGALRTSAQLPDVQYRFLRGGLDARVALGAVSVYGYASYLGVLSTGLFGTYFARASVGGIEGRIGAAHAIARSFELSLEIAYTRFYYSLHPQPGDAYVAGGALDQIARGSLRIAYLF
jgi:hypothetical protein